MPEQGKVFRSLMVGMALVVLSGCELFRKPQVDMRSDASRLTGVQLPGGGAAGRRQGVQTSSRYVPRSGTGSNTGAIERIRQRALGGLGSGSAGGAVAGGGLPGTGIAGSGGVNGLITSDGYAVDTSPFPDDLFSTSAIAGGIDGDIAGIQQGTALSPGGVLDEFGRPVAPGVADTFSVSENPFVAGGGAGGASSGGAFLDGSAGGQVADGGAMGAMGAIGADGSLISGGGRYGDGGAGAGSGMLLGGDEEGGIDSIDFMASTGQGAAFAAEQGAFLEAVGSDRVFFLTDQYILNDTAQRVLDRQVQWLQRHPDKAVVIEGHCDERGTREYDLALGERRASAVRDYLVTAGINPARIRTVSYGKERPVEVCSQPRCWARNRRAVTVISSPAGVGGMAFQGAY